MIFKRRDPKPFLRALAEALWPRGGWTRAFHYVKHRVRRVPIGIASLKTGHWLLGTRMAPDEHRSFGGKFYDAGTDLWDNLIAVFQGHPTDWTGLDRFFHDVFFPYLVGGIIPGIICGTIAYYISVPLLRAYQKRRKGAIKAKFEALKAKAAEKAAAKAASKSEARTEQD